MGDSVCLAPVERVRVGEKEELRRGESWLVLFFRDAQRRTSHMDGDTMVLETVEDGIDQ